MGTNEGLFSGEVKSEVIVLTGALPTNLNGRSEGRRKVKKAREAR